MHTPSFQPCRLDWSALFHVTPEWFRDAKFGLFFHWGPYVVPACENEWYSRNMYHKGLSQNRHHEKTYGKLSEFGYKDFYDQLTGEHFDPEAWADLIVLSGARYAGPVAEHADNFSLWDSAVNPVNSVNYGPHRDVVGELKQAITRRGLKFVTTFHHQWLWGWFMSTDPDADVYHPANEKFYGKALPLEANRYIPWRLPDKPFNQMWLAKVEEVLEKYDPDLVYFDSRMAAIDEPVRLAMLRHCYFGPSGRNDRVVTYKQEDLPVGTAVLDVERGRFATVQDFAWQTDDRLEDCVTWCYVHNARYRSVTSVIHQLIDIVSKNGNLLLNVGPKADGSFDASAVSVLHGIGDWLKTYGEAIYGTRPFLVHGEGAADTGSSGFDVAQIEQQTQTGIENMDSNRILSPGDVRYTRNGDSIYAIIPFSQERNEIRLSTFGSHSGKSPFQILQAEVINSTGEVSWERNADALIVTSSAGLPDAHANVIRIRTAPVK